MRTQQHQFQAGVIAIGVLVLSPGATVPSKMLHQEVRTILTQPAIIDTEPPIRQPLQQEIVPPLLFPRESNRAHVSAWAN